MRESKRFVGWAVTAGACGFALSRLLRALRAIDFTGKPVLIFGGSRGLGLVIAREFAAEGARVTLAARNLDELERAQRDLAGLGTPAAIVRCDVRDRSAVEATVERVIDEHSAIDVLVNTSWATDHMLSICSR
jgi:NAD(P)-dependent dehydrogenase (short-subunit alcohol dehydrogenase family)